MHTVVFILLLVGICICWYLFAENERIYHIIDKASEKMRLQTWLETVVTLSRLTIATYETDEALEKVVKGYLDQDNDIDEETKSDLYHFMDKANHGNIGCKGTVQETKAQAVAMMSLLKKDIEKLYDQLNKSPFNTKHERETLTKDITRIQNVIHHQGK